MDHHGQPLQPVLDFAAPPPVLPPPPEAPYKEQSYAPVRSMHRASDPETSVESATAMGTAVKKLRDIQQRALDILIETPAGLTAEELHTAYVEKWGAMAYSTVPKRLTELHRLGLAVRTDKKRATSSGASAFVYVAAADCTTMGTAPQ